MGLLGNVNFDDQYERENFNETMKNLRNRYNFFFLNLILHLNYFKTKKLDNERNICLGNTAVWDKLSHCSWYLL